MKHTILFSIAIFSTLALTAQISLTAADYFPAEGDTLRVATDFSPEGIAITTPGGDQIWDFTSLDGSADATERVVFPAVQGEAAGSYPNANLLIEQAAGGEGYYLSNDDAFSIIGFAGQDPLDQGLEVNTPFAPPYVERWAPLVFFDLRTHESSLLFAFSADDVPGGIFDQLPVTPDSIRILVSTERTDLVDAWGTLQIPGGSYDVLREKRTEMRDVRLEVLVPPFPWADITDLVIDQLPIDQLGTDTLVTYSFWGAEKEPVAVINSNSTGDAVEFVSYKFNGIISNNETVVTQQPGMRVYPNPAMVTTQIQLNNLPSDQYRVEVFNLVGKTIYSEQYFLYGNHDLALDVTRFPKGMYLLSVKDTQGRTVGVKRLMVAKP